MKIDEYRNQVGYGNIMLRTTLPKYIFLGFTFLKNKLFREIDAVIIKTQYFSYHA